MSSDSSKTEKPTPKKLRDARKEGNVGQSRDLTLVIVLIIFLIMLLVLKYQFAKLISSNYHLVFQTILSNKFDIYIIYAVIFQIVKNTLLVLIVIIACGAATGATITVIQSGGFIISDKLFKFSLEKLNVVTNIQELFSKKNFLKIILNCLKFSILAFIASYYIYSNINQLLLLGSIGLAQVIGLVMSIIYKIVAVLLVVFFLFACIDLILEKRSVYNKLMMSKDEVKKEFKEMEGDPEIKGKRREFFQEILNDDFSDSPNANSMFVLANPTHIAILIIYLPLRVRLPVILLKAKDAEALSVFKVAKRKNIPIIRDKWLARQLYELAIINRPVPTTLAQHMATLIAKNMDILPQIAKDIDTLTKLKKQEKTITTQKIKV